VWCLPENLNLQLSHHDIVQKTLVFPDSLQIQCDESFR